MSVVVRVLNQRGALGAASADSVSVTAGLPVSLLSPPCISRCRVRPRVDSAGEQVRCCVRRVWVALQVAEIGFGAVYEEHPWRGVARAGDERQLLFSVTGVGLSSEGEARRKVAPRLELTWTGHESAVARWP